MRTPIYRAIISGFTAGVAMLATFLTAYGTIRLAATPGSDAWNLVHASILDPLEANLYTAFEVHTLVAQVFALTYALLLERRLRARPFWAKGVAVSLVPWILSISVFLPIVGAGMFGSRLNAGALPALGNLVLHLVYGMTLCVVYDCTAERSAQPVEVPNDRIARGAARGLLCGLLVAVVATQLGIVPSVVPDITGVGAYWTALFSATLGLLCGSLTALPALPTAARGSA